MKFHNVIIDVKSFIANLEAYRVVTTLPTTSP